jgi:hypothetical protein
MDIFVHNQEPSFKTSMDAIGRGVLLQPEKLHRRLEIEEVLFSSVAFVCSALIYF